MNAYKKPPKLKKGDTVGIIAPSDAVERKYVQEGSAVLESWGLKVKFGKHIYAQIGDFAAGTPEERRSDLVKMINDPQVKAIWMAQGGYAATEILPAFSREIVAALKHAPKWFVGYSDSCVLLNSLFSFKVIGGVHGPNLSGLPSWDEETREWLKKILFTTQHLEIGSGLNWISHIYGKAEGRLLVSNLEGLVLLLGTRFDPLMHCNDDIILGIEEWWVDKSTLQRQVDTILNHKRANLIKGIILGRFAGVAEQSYPEWGKKVTTERLIESRVRMQKPNTPLASLYEFGHVLDKNWFQRKLLPKKDRFISTPNGVWAQLIVDSSSANLKFMESASNTHK